MKYLFFLVPVLFAVFPYTEAFAASVSYRVASASDGSPGTGISFVVPHSAGVHHGTATVVSGELEAEWGAPSFSGKLSVPIASMQTGNDKRDCHMREALGIDYTHSRFPAEHVCDAQNRIPAEGDDAIRFPTVDFELLDLRRVDNGQPLNLEEGKAIPAIASVRLTIHGVVQDKVALPVTVAFASDGTGKVRVDGETPLKLSDFGIQVKPFLMITVKNEIRLAIHTLLAPEGR